MSNYLSIDLDYWADFSVENGSKKMIAFLEKVMELDVPINVVAYHDDMTKYINRIHTDIERVINVDTHSDIVDKDYFNGSRYLDEACWANFIKGKREKENLWNHPDAECRGRCDRYEDPFTNKSLEICGWGKCKHKRGLPSRSQMEEVIAVGICISPNWSEMLHVDDALNYFIERGLITKRFMGKIMEELKTCKFKYSGDNGLGRKF